ncbi:NAD-dependent epimerase/dehydratase family protein [Enemella sp. A6]|uniref:NAD-dependent epimerase/dehydratase family protein n=1 Tax=Enemella sp. A6 TaxID=3440152 RepID=UPI003EB99E39
MKVLVVGGSGMIGASTARYLKDQGADVTVGVRSALPEESPVADLPVLIGDYMAGTYHAEMLSPFDAIVFAAGQDVRHKPADVDDDEFWKSAQIEGVPRFAELAKQAGVRRFVQVGSYYHMVLPDLAETNAYVAARKAADDGARALADESFNVSTVNPPSIIGVIPGVPAKRFRRLVSWAAGKESQIPDTAPPGGTNYMTVRSLAEAIWGALNHAEPGRAYLVGDRNLTYQQYFQMLVDAAGGDRTITTVDEEHRFLPDVGIVHGRGTVLSYEPPAEDVAALGYTRNDVERGIDEVVSIVKPLID